mgnify:CR=1 FL=1
MSLEDDLRAALRQDDTTPPAGGGLDARAAIAGARRRRRPRVAIATAGMAFAGLGILAIAVPVVLSPFGATSTSESGGAPMSERYELAQPEQDAAVPANACGAPPSWLVARSGEDLAIDASLTMVEPSAGPSVDVTVRVANATGDPISARVTTDSALVADGVVIGTPRITSAEPMMPESVSIAADRSTDLTMTTAFDLCAGIPTDSAVELVVVVTIDAVSETELRTSGSAFIEIEPAPIVLVD